MSWLKSKICGIGTCSNQNVTSQTVARIASGAELLLQMEGSQQVSLRRPQTCKFPVLVSVEKTLQFPGDAQCTQDSTTFLRFNASNFEAWMTKTLSNMWDPVEPCQVPSSVSSCEGIWIRALVQHSNSLGRWGPKAVRLPLPNPINLRNQLKRTRTWQLLAAIGYCPHNDKQSSKEDRPNQTKFEQIPGHTTIDSQVRSGFWNPAVFKALSSILQRTMDCSHWASVVMFVWATRDCGSFQNSRPGPTTRLYKYGQMSEPLHLFPSSLASQERYPDVFLFHFVSSSNWSPHKFERRLLRSERSTHLAAFLLKWT